MAQRPDRTISGANLNSERLLNSEAVLAIPHATAAAESLQTETSQNWHYAHCRYLDTQPLYSLGSFS